MHPSSNPRCFKISIAADVPGQFRQVEKKPESERRLPRCLSSPLSTVLHLLISPWTQPTFALLPASPMFHGPWPWQNWLRLSLAARAQCCISKALANPVHSFGRQLGVSMAPNASSVIFAMPMSASAATRRREWQCMRCRQAERHVWVPHHGIREVAGLLDSA